MRTVIQRVKQAQVAVEAETVGRIGPGLLVLVAVANGDTEVDSEALAAKISSLRVFPDDQNKMNRSLLDVGGEVLVVSQFTLYGEVGRGRRPSFDGAADPQKAESILSVLISEFEALGLRVASGRFGAHMQVELTNDGPVTLIVETSEGKVR